MDEPSPPHFHSHPWSPAAKGWRAPTSVLNQPHSCSSHAGAVPMASSDFPDLPDLRAMSESDSGSWTFYPLGLVFTRVRPPGRLWASRCGSVGSWEHVSHCGPLLTGDRPGWRGQRPLSRTFLQQGGALRGGLSICPLFSRALTLIFDRYVSPSQLSSNEHLPRGKECVPNETFWGTETISILIFQAFLE